MILGIDPGLNGALAWVTADGALAAVIDMPTSANAQGKRKIDAAILADAMRTPRVHAVVIEQVSTRPGEGHVGACTVGYGGGIIEGIAVGLGLTVRLMGAAMWKRCAQVTSNKSLCRQRAQQLWPDHDALFRLAKHDGRADAALLAHWFATSGAQKNLSDHSIFSVDAPEKSS